MMHAFLLSLLALFPGLAAPGARAQETEAREAARSLDASKLKDEIDRSLRWLRGQQASDGGYGSQAATAQTLLAFATSPRRYRPADGPFVGRAVERLLAEQADDGAFAPEETSAELRRAQTLSALRALEELGTAEEARARAARFLGLPGPRTEAGGTNPHRDVPTDVLLDRAAELLVERDADGSWSNDDPHDTEGAVRRTATNLTELSGLHRSLAARAPRGAISPTDARPLPAFRPGDREAARAAWERGARFLLAESADGRWGFDDRADPGLTAMAVGALLALPEPRPQAVDAAVAAALDWLVSLQKPDGSIHAGQLANYVTSASVLALAAAQREEDRAVVERARAFLVALQADEGEGYAPGDRYYGGVGYGGDERPDLSNLQMALEALAAAGVEADDGSFQKALVFLQRCQNRSESNDLVTAIGDERLIPGDDGGAGYAPGESKAGFVELADGRRVPRSYGSMTYALFKGYLLAGLTKDDPRVEAAWEWIGRNYTLDLNPGFEASSDPAAAYQGLYYYFLAMARALELYGAEEIVDPQGTVHRWRTELIGRLNALQRPDGSWRNDNSARWFEGNPVLATAYAMLALGAASGDG